MPGIGVGRRWQRLCVRAGSQRCARGWWRAAADLGTERLPGVGAAVSFHGCLSQPNSCCFSSQQRAPGKVLLDAVCNHLNLVEGDYFGLEFPDHKKITVGDVHGMLGCPVCPTQEREIMGPFLGHTDLYTGKSTPKPLGGLILKATCASD